MLSFIGRSLYSVSVTIVALSLDKLYQMAFVPDPDPQITVNSDYRTLWPSFHKGLSLGLTPNSDKPSGRGHSETCEFRLRGRVKLEEGADNLVDELNVLRDM